MYATVIFGFLGGRGCCTIGMLNDYGSLTRTLYFKNIAQEYVFLIVLSLNISLLFITKI